MTPYIHIGRMWLPRHSFEVSSNKLILGKLGETDDTVHYLPRIVHCCYGTDSMDGHRAVPYSVYWSMTCLAEPETQHLLCKRTPHMGLLAACPETC